MNLTGEQALDRLQKQYNRQNEYNKKRYDRLGTTFEKGTSDRIKAHGYTVGSFLREAVFEKLDRLDDRNEIAEANIPEAKKADQETDNASGLTPMNEVLGRILAEHVSQK